MIQFYAEDATITHTCAKECAACQADAVLPDSKGMCSILIDRCVLADVLSLWELGVKTVCSCCGHSGNEHGAFVAVDHKDSERMKALGYEEAPLLHDHCVGCGAFFRPKLFGLEVERCTT